MTTVAESVNEKTDTFLQTFRINLCKGVVASRKVPNCPTENSLKAATISSPVHFSPTLNKLPDQSTIPWEKQKFVLKKFISVINLYLSADSSFIPHHFVLGRPGTGKSTVSLIALCYALSRGLNCMITTLAGEKAAQLGGIHLHRLIPLMPTTNLPVIKQVESTIQNLYRDPTRLVLLKKLDVLVIEEIGMLNSEQWSVLDQTLRFINNSNAPMGGILVFENGDPKQLRPQSGPLLWISPLLFTNFNFYYSKDYVRMNDPNGTKVLQLLDQKELTDANEIFFRNAIIHECKFYPKTNFLTSWDQLPTDSPTLKVVPTKMAERKLVIEQTNVITSQNFPNKTIAASDEISRRGQNIWTKTKDNNVTASLNKYCLEPENLFLYQDAPMRITRNDTELQLCQGQLCVIRNLQSSDDSHVDLFVAPPCNRDLPAREN